MQLLICNQALEHSASQSAFGSTSVSQKEIQ